MFFSAFICHQRQKESAARINTVYGISITYSSPVVCGNMMGGITKKSRIIKNSVEKNRFCI